MSGLLHTGDENDWSDLGLDGGGGGGGGDGNGPANGSGSDIRELDCFSSALLHFVYIRAADRRVVCLWK